MLSHLSIRNVLLISRVDLDFTDGLNVLTGETGAGKSILLDALGFVLGHRGRAEIVRAGAARGEVTAQFDLPKTHAANAVLLEAGLPVEENLILRRINTPDGKKRAFVNDNVCSAEVLRRLSDVLLEVHGQHDDRGLLDPKAHLELLDSYANNEALLGKTRAAWRMVLSARTALDKARAKLEQIAKDTEFLRHAVAELSQLDPQPGDDKELDAKRRLMQGAERIRGDISSAAQALAMDGAEGAMVDALRWLQDADDAAEGQLNPAIEALSRAMVELSDAQNGVDLVLSNLDFNPVDLEITEERLFAIRALARKHDVLPDDLTALWQRFEQTLTEIDQGDGHLAALQSTLDAAETRYGDVAGKLSEKRSAAGKRLDKAMKAELVPLKMERAGFITDVTRVTAGATGFDEVSFSVVTNPGAPAGPINRIASGGELSRFLLALKVCLTTRTAGLTLIFDEIDRGVGGATADAVGRRLQAVASETQVLVVTHSPQVAALGAQHFLVSKHVAKGETRTEVVVLNPAERRDEIARMLAGEVVTDAAKAAADALLAP